MFLLMQKNMKLKNTAVGCVLCAANVGLRVHSGHSREFHGQQQLPRALRPDPYQAQGIWTEVSGADVTNSFHRRSGKIFVGIWRGGGDLSEAGASARRGSTVVETFARLWHPDRRGVQGELDLPAV